MRMAILGALESSAYVGGVLTLYLAGVKLHIDDTLDELFIQVDAEHERWALKALGDLADRLGYEVMPESECPSQTMPDGGLRHWLAEKFDREEAYDECLVQAV